MDLYSPYIKRYQKDIEEAGYTISDNGSQLSKRIGRYVILITDLSVKGIFINNKTLLIWIKNTETKIIEKEILIKQEVLPLPFYKIEKGVRDIIVKSISKHEVIDYKESLIKTVVHDII